MALLQAGQRVVLLDNLSNSTASILRRIEIITGKQAAFVRADVRDTALVNAYLDAAWVRCRHPFCRAQGRG